MTVNISATAATSSVIAVEGVSGEMATPAFMFLLWIASMRASGSAVVLSRFITAELLNTERHPQVASRWKQ